MNMEMMSNFEEMVTQLHEATETQSNLSEQLNAKQAQIKDLQLNTVFQLIFSCRVVSHKLSFLTTFIVE